MRTKTRIMVGVILIIVVGAFFAGYWPESRRRAALEADNASLRTQMTGLEDRVRLSRLHGSLLDLIDAVAAMNYGQAQSLSSTLFDYIRAEIDRTHERQYRDALQELLGRRDFITSALAKADASVLELLRDAERGLRQLLARPTSIAV